jgi:hypothetical protein
VALDAGELLRDRALRFARCRSRSNIRAYQSKKIPTKIAKSIKMMTKTSAVWLALFAGATETLCVGVGDGDESDAGALKRNV